MAFQNELNDFRYFLLMANVFHVIFNSVPQLLVQSVYLSSPSSRTIMNQFSNGNSQSIHIYLLILKISISFFRICWTSTKLVEHFLAYEFKLNFRGAQKWKFMLFRFGTNFFTLYFRFIPFVILAIYYKPLCLLLILLKYLRSIIVEVALFRQRNNEKKMIGLEIFWCFILGFLKATVIIDEIDMFETKIHMKNIYYLFNIFLSFIELISVFIIIFLKMDLSNFLVTIVFLVTFYVNSNAIEYYYWTVVYERKPFIRKNFKNWIRLQSMQLKSTEETKNEENERFLSA